MGYDSGSFDLQTRGLEPLDNRFVPKFVTYVAGAFCYPMFPERTLEIIGRPWQTIFELF